MIKLATLSISILFVFGLASCSNDPQAIEWGADQCDYCKMNIVDRMHAAQYVTIKGKQHKFDAIECLIAQLEEVNENELAHILVSDYGAKGEMTDARQSTYLISKKIKSPMGACLSAFAANQTAENTRKEFDGELFDWNAIKAELAD